MSKNENKIEEPKLHNHDFECLDCKFKFSYQSEISDVNKFKDSLARGVRCPKCDKEWGSKEGNIQIILNVSAGSGKSLEARRRENRERSFEAIKQARAFQDAGGGPEMVDVQRRGSMGAPTQFGRNTERVPKSVIDSLKGKALPNEPPE